MAIAQALDPIFNKLKIFQDYLSEKIFGHNAERLDLVMDSFNKLSPKKRSMTIAGLVCFVILLVVGIFFLYFSQVNKLGDTLSSRKNDLAKLTKLGKNFNIESAKFDSLVSQIQKKIRGLRVKASFEKIANGVGVNIDSIDEKLTTFDSENPLQNNFKKLDAEIRVSKISIPELLDFLVEIEKADNLFQIADLNIRGRYGTKLYFDAIFRVHGVVNNEG